MLGVCYYPEHWPQAKWRADAARMADLGLTYVRIGEFAWSRFEPKPGDYRFDWFDEAIAVLTEAGLKVVIGTPTATPPKWLVDLYPDILPVDPATGRVRGFGSRRHYDFSSQRYLAEALRITEKLAERYGDHAGVAGWQTDNELCCHETALSASVAARDAFRHWLKARYGDIASLNAAWGNVFWSMEYGDFSEIELPVGAVTETSPAHRLAWRRFASDQVVKFHDALCATIRRYAKNQFVTHNFIPMRQTGIDNVALAAPLDFASYDNYPLGHADMAMADMPAEIFRRYMRTGHPDLSAYAYDQTRCLTPSRRFWVMEQQPGPVNWARHNPKPAPGMVRLWTWEAFAHGATCVSYFRWRQAPFAQEQMHAGLRRPDDSAADAWPEVQRLAGEIERLKIHQYPSAPAPVAILADCQSQWVSEIERQGDSYDHEAVQLSWYSALRRLGVDVDFLAPGADCTGYRLIVAPGLAMLSDDVVQALASSGAHLIFGPRTGAKTADFTIPEGLPPGPLRAVLPIRVLAVETLRPGCGGTLIWKGKRYGATTWRESLDAETATVLARYEDDSPAVVAHGSAIYVATVADDAFLLDFFAAACSRAGIATQDLPDDLRLRRRGALTFAFNYADRPVPAPAPKDAVFLLGGSEIAPRDVAAWRES
ncbi:MAG: beta-galactosidase [Alphaproteobacteria bacterium]|nr:MAG: beta-galactosidase [Alphaproteobacteria bacterium]